jgi:hypothetical protein
MTTEDGEGSEEPDLLLSPTSRRGDDGLTPLQRMSARATEHLADSLGGFSLSELVNIYGLSDPESLRAELVMPADPDDTAEASQRLAEADKDKHAPPTPVQGMDGLRHARERAMLKSDEQDTDLRKILAWWSVGAASTMLVLGTGVFTVFMISQWGRVPTAAIIAWISSSVVEVLGIVYLVASYLFPKSPE